MESMEEGSDMTVGQVLLAIWSSFEQPEIGASASLCTVFEMFGVELSSSPSKKLHREPRRRQFPHPDLIASH